MRYGQRKMGFYHYHFYKFISSATLFLMYLYRQRQLTLNFHSLKRYVLHSKFHLCILVLNNQYMVSFSEIVSTIKGKWGFAIITFISFLYFFKSSSATLLPIYLYRRGSSPDFHHLKRYVLPQRCG